MIARLDFRGTALDLRSLRERLPRGAAGTQAAAEAVRPILADVRDRGAAAVQDATERFDRVRPEHLLVPEAAIEAAVARLDPEVRAALEESIRRQRRVSEAQLPAEPRTTFGLNATVSDRWRPVDRVGLYIPGGLAVYPSSVVMNAVPAITAGVASIVIASPPGPDGLPHADILAAAGLLGVRTVLAAGGAQAIAALAYGLPDADGEVLDPVDLITGPGNAFVAAAKSEVRSFVGIDAVAGPTEVIVLADETARPELVAADLISQAEHDPQAAAVLVTPDAELLEAVAASLGQQVPAARHAERIATALSGEQSALILVDDLEAGIAVLNAYAGEHVEVMTAEPAAVAERIRHGGAIFLGDHSPVSLGDYCSGSNHVLPTLAGARHTSGLGVTAFLRRTQIIDYDRAGLAEVAAQVQTLAEVEQLPAHGEAVAIRFRGVTVNCPFCRSPESRVVDSRAVDDGSSIRRRRHCQNCNRRFTTIEITSLMVVKRSGISEEFSRRKVIGGVRKACQGRPVSEDDLALLAQRVEDRIRSGGVAAIPADEVGLAILEPLRELDQVAYLRFASVYQGFDTLADFEAAIASLKDDARAAERGPEEL